MGWSNQDSGGWTGSGSGGGGGSDAAATTAFLARTSGLSPTETLAYRNLINGMVADGTFALLDALYIFATNTTTTANLNLISTSFGLTQTGSVTFTADQGYTGDGVTGFLDTGLIPPATNYTQNSASLGVAIQTNDTTSQTMLEIGSSGGGFNSVLGPNFSLTSIFALNESGFNQPASTTSRGLWAISRTGVSTESLYSNGSSSPVSAATTTTSAVSTTSIFICGRDTGSNLSNRQISAAWIGGGLTGSQFASISTRINAYLSALGVNVY